MGLDIYFTTQQYIVSSNFRKINCLVAWFSTHLASVSTATLENCTDYPISKQELYQLLDDVDKVLNNPALARKLLPTCKGFFFGSYVYDTSYFNNLRYVKSEVTHILETHCFDNEKLNVFIWY